MDQPPLPVTSTKKYGKGCLIGIFTIAIICIAINPLLSDWILHRNRGFRRQFGARSTEQGIVIALKAYKAEYNQFPLFGERYPDSEVLTSSGLLLKALMGEDDKINPREVKFIDPPIARNNVNGLLEKDGKRILVDPWGEPYAILLDFDGDGKVPDPEHPSAMLSTTVIVFSGGPDGDPTTWQDNVRSWGD